MRARARLAAEVDSRGRTRLVMLRSAAPLLLRPTPFGVYLVGGAAGPLGGDALTLEVEVGPGAAITVRTAAASVALPGPAGSSSSLTVDARVAENGAIRWLPEPAVAAAGCRHRLSVALSLAAGARALWRDELVLGRHGEEPGEYSSRMCLHVGGRPVMRQELVVGGAGSGWDGPAVTGGARALGSVVCVDPTWESSPPAAAVLGPTAAVLPLAGPAAQVVALAPDAITLRRLLDRGSDLLAAGFRPDGPSSARPQLPEDSTGATRSPACGRQPA